MDFAHAFESVSDDNNPDQSLSPGVDCQGALEAARRFTDDQVLHTGYRLVLVNGDIVIHIIIIILISSSPSVKDLLSDGSIFMLFFSKYKSIK